MYALVIFPGPGVRFEHVTDRARLLVFALIYEWANPFFLNEGDNLALHPLSFSPSHRSLVEWSFFIGLSRPTKYSPLRMVIGTPHLSKLFRVIVPERTVTFFFAAASLRRSPEASNLRRGARLSMDFAKHNNLSLQIPP